MDVLMHEKWLDETLPKHQRLTESVSTILENLLKTKRIDFLTIEGRTKDKASALEKIKRKGYKHPNTQLTDLTGIRVIVYFESDVKKVSKLIDNAFCIDKNNSLNLDELLSADQLGYRSVHFVCDLGKNRASLPEFMDLSNLKFEFQVRTILQHAWAELAHDRNYKFSGKLPRKIERKLYLYAGMIEIADKGFDELSTEIDIYIGGLLEKAEKGDLDTEINSISLEQFIENWCHKNDLELELLYSKDQYSDLINELDQFGIHTLTELNNIIPENYVDICKAIRYKSTIYGYIRDWMLMNDWRKLINTTDINWVMSQRNIFYNYFDKNEFKEFFDSFEWDQSPEEW